MFHHHHRQHEHPSRWSIEVITPPAIEPVTLDEAKTHCRAGDDEDSLITAIITVAREYCEGVQNRAFVTQTLEFTLDAWPAKPFQLPMPPLQSVESIKYIDSDGAETTLAATEYVVGLASGRIALAAGKLWPMAVLAPIDAIKIQYVAGYKPGGTIENPDMVANVPKKVKQAMLLLIGHWYANREALAAKDAGEVGFAVTALLSLDRVVPV